MVQYHGPNLEHHKPSLWPGEKCVITQFHDKSCFHANEFKKSAWCGQTIQDAWKIIYPSAAGDAWWDTAQLLTQVTNAIDIFNVTHPECEALFIFDQSSTHTSLGPNALHPFKMNKGDGGKQHKKSDTIIPDDNPNISLCEKVQKMTTDSGAARGLQTVLEEHGIDTKGICAKCSPICPFKNERCCLAHIFSKQHDVINQVSMLEELITKVGHHCIFLPKFHCELNPIEMYWGYSKYCYCEAFKVTFADAKATAMDSLESCPLDTIHHFINCHMTIKVGDSESLKPGESENQVFEAQKPAVWPQ
ncbi:hypothetical protein BS47DRAFT_1374361 [Hydnum rufescens UP504]|uniref:Uncharacterized protein n=1 Tax=Hydnum rufescens UP504 TaxID=1448309 RepID=A0A9P6AFI4_9AGAM|nr:hypothetical protein BS47DRAFT_1374361 [Hydnum rufescens UP504]